MNCPNCNQVLSGNEKFCANCGRELNVEINNVTQNVNTELLNKLTLAHEALLPIYKRMNDINEIENRHHPFFDFVNEKLNLNGDRMKFYRYIGGAIVLWAFVQPFLANIFGARAIVETFTNIPLIFIVLIYLSYRNWKKEKIEADKVEVDDLEEAIRVMLNLNNGKISIIPEEYRYPLSTEYLVKIVSQGRANTLNKALEMCDEQMHRLNMEESQAQIIAEQQYQSKELREIKLNTRVSAVASTLYSMSKWLNK